MNEHEITAMSKLRELTHCKAMIAEITATMDLAQNSFNNHIKARPVSNGKTLEQWKKHAADTQDLIRGIKSILLRLNERYGNLQAALLAELEDVGYSQRNKDSI